MAFGYSHAYGVGYALSQRSGSSFNPGSVAVFGMAGSAAAPLPEGFNILHCYVVAADMQSGIKQHGACLLYTSHGRSCFCSGANAVISGDMLTTAGITVQTDMAMIKELGYEAGCKNE